MNTWVLVERGLTGTENQCLGVCDALGVTPVIRHFTLKQPWKSVSPYVNLGIKHGYDGDDLRAPWPDLVIAGGRKAAGLALWIKKASRGKTFVVCLQDPRVGRRAFDLIAVPAHDPARGKNVVVTTAAPNRITSERLALARAKWENSFASLPRPRVAVLIGGNSKAYNFSSVIAGGLGESLKKLATDGAGLMVTASRRTGPDNLAILNGWLKDTGAYIWDGKGDNPYEGFLALADVILVTADSVSMTSEAASTGKPVYRIDLQGGARRLNKFHAGLELAGISRPFLGSIDRWSYNALRDADIVAAAIRERMKA
jgi:mitochondrial fission protein ELM1